MRVIRGFKVRLAAIALAATMVAGCAQLREYFYPTAPFVSAEWAALLEEVRAFQRRIGFVDTGNFSDLTKEFDGYPICGHTSRYHLPYSYEDPAIKWRDVETEKECLLGADGSDMLFTMVEAWGEIGTPVTPSMLDGKLDRFLYLVIHEDCHDQFELPYGIEEALCNLITYRAMAAFSRVKFGPDSREHRAIRRYAEQQSELTRTTKAVYDQLALVYARYDRKEISQDALLAERAAVYKKSHRALGPTRAEPNNVMIANDMTYSRHYPFLETVYEALGRDLARTVAFFRQVDKAKPTPAEVVKKYRLKSETGLEFVRAYEAEVVRTIEKALADPGRR
jgi:hypothetical protein